MCPIVNNNLVVKILTVVYCQDKQIIGIMASNESMRSIASTLVIAKQKCFMVKKVYGIAFYSSLIDGRSWGVYA